MRISSMDRRVSHFPISHSLLGLQPLLSARLVEFRTLTLFHRSDEAFRVVLNIAASSKRTYLTSIRSTIQRHKLARPDDRLIWIFSLREDRGCLLTLEWTCGKGREKCYL